MEELHGRNREPDPSAFASLLGNGWAVWKAHIALRFRRPDEVILLILKIQPAEVRTFRGFDDLDRLNLSYVVQSHEELGMTNVPIDAIAKVAYMRMFSALY